MPYSHKIYDFYSASFVFIFTLYVFRGYILGDSVPPWDFFGDYFTQAYSWWDLGSFFNPTSYLPYLISGYPSHLGLQFSGYYLPVGIVAEFFEYTILNAARLQALTIALGIVGVYFFARKWKITNGSATVAAIGYLFSAGFFSNASHIDVVRAWAFLPWLLLALSPLEKIRFWAIPFVSILWFQFFVGAYPGNIVSFAYLILIYCVVLFMFNKDKIKIMLTWYLLTVIPGILLSGLKWIPFLISGTGPQVQNQVKVNLGIFSTIFFPYGGTGQSGDLVLPNDLTQRTFFIIPILLLLAAFARNNKFLITVSVALLSSSIMLGIDFPFIAHWQENLPLLDVSRFRTIDFKPGISLSVCLLAAVGLDNLIFRGRLFPKFKNNKIEYIQYALAALVVFFATFVGSNIGFTDQDVRKAYTWIAISILSIGLIFIFLKLKAIRVINLFILVVVCYTGVSWTNSFKNPWQVPRVPTENLYFGNEVNNIIAAANPKEIESRPARVGPNLPIPYPGEMIIQFWNSNDLYRTYSTAGYVTIKGEENFNKYIEYALDEKNYKVIDFLQKESQILITNLENQNVDECVVLEKCDFIENKSDFVSFSPGSFIVKLNPLKNDQRLIVNEIGWRGWQGKACTSEGECQKITIADQESNLLLNATLPKDTINVEFEYKTPGMLWTWIIFWVTIVFVLILSIIGSKKNKIFGNK